MPAQGCRRGTWCRRGWWQRWRGGGWWRDVVELLQSVPRGQLWVGLCLHSVTLWYFSCIVTYKWGTGKYTLLTLPTAIWQCEKKKQRHLIYLKLNFLRISMWTSQVMFKLHCELLVSLCKVRFQFYLKYNGEQIMKYLKQPVLRLVYISQFWCHG